MYKNIKGIKSIKNIKVDNNCAPELVTLTVALHVLRSILTGSYIYFYTIHMVL